MLINYNYYKTLQLVTHIQYKIIKLDKKLFKHISNV